MYYDILLGPNFVSAIRNRGVSSIGRVLKYYINKEPFNWDHFECPLYGGVHYWEISIKGGSTTFT